MSKCPARDDRKKITSELWEQNHQKIVVRLEHDQAEQMRKLASAARLKTSTVVGKLLAYALEKLAQAKKRRDGARW